MTRRTGEVWEDALFAGDQWSPVLCGERRSYPSRVILERSEESREANWDGALVFGRPMIAPTMVLCEAVGADGTRPFGGSSPEDRRS